MNLADLETFLSVIQARSFSRAAEKLCRTQPAVSLAIRRLEAACGERLLDRSDRDIRPTQAGELLRDRALRMLDQRDLALRELLELRGKHRGSVTVGANESTAFFLLPVIETFRRQFPQVRVEIRRSRSRDIPAEILAANLDLGITAYDPRQRELTSSIVFQDRLAFVVFPSHPLATRRRQVPINLDRLGQESFIAHNVESPYRDFTVNTFRRLQVPLHIDLEMPSLESIKHLVARGLGVAFLPRISVAHELATGSLCEVEIRQLRVRRPLRLLARRRGTLSHAARAFWESATAVRPSA